ncbi:MAG TPA: hypothetical protein VF038_17200 [Usitatibacter sp.]|jgi:hypothetical protein
MIALRALACASLASLAGCGFPLRSTPPAPPPMAQAAPAPRAAQPPAAPSGEPGAKPPKVEAKVEPKHEPKPEPKPPSNADTTPRPKPQAQPPSNAGTKAPRDVGTKAPPKGEPKAQPKPEASAQAKPAAPPLDLDSLERRLKETDAIGVMTKLSLKNQVDDLLDQFRDYYAGRARTTLAQLRRPFDLLLMKVLSLLQDRDPALARAIHDSREALWAILADRARFEKLA